MQHWLFSYICSYTAGRRIALRELKFPNRYSFFEFHLALHGISEHHSYT